MAGDTVSRGGESSTLSPLTRLRQTVFPIYGDEVKKFLLLGSIKFFIIMALTLTRDTKDTLVVTQCGAEAIAFLKVSQQFNYKDEAVHSWLFKIDRKLQHASALVTQENKRRSHACLAVFSLSE